MRSSVALFVVLILVAASASAGGFQITAQGARAMGMGLAFTAVANDASAIYYNPAGLAFEDHLVITAGAMVASNLEGTLTSPSGLEEQQRDGLNLLPQAYVAAPFGPLRIGVGAYAPFGLPLRWENPATFSGRHTSYTANISTANLNPTVAIPVTDHFAIGFGADWVHSKIQLERRSLLPSGPALDVADAKLKSDLFDADGWGWNAGVLWRGDAWRFGASYRSAIDIDHEPTLKITQILTGIQPIDNGVAGTIPAGPLDAHVPIELPASLNLGLAYEHNGVTVAMDADRTDWSAFSQLIVDVPARPDYNITRNTKWEDTWAYRVGIEAPCGPVACRAGYYVDETPQPRADVGPVLADADRQGITVGLGIGPHGRWSLDVGYVYVLFDERTTTATGPTVGTDKLAGTWKTIGNELAFNVNYRR